MILFIPMLGIAKIVFDNVESLKPYGYVIADPDGNKPSVVKEWVLKLFGKKKTRARKKNMIDRTRLNVKQLAGRSIINKDRLTAS